MKEYGKLDILVNNAGILDEKDWERTLCVNLVGTFAFMHLGLGLGWGGTFPKFR